MLNQNEIGLVDRFLSPTPKVFSTIRNIGIILAALAGAIMTIGKDMQLPAIFTLIADKATVIAGLIAATIAQLTVDYKEKSLEDIRPPDEPFIFKNDLFTILLLFSFSFSMLSCTSPVVRGKIVKLENKPPKVVAGIYFAEKWNVIIEDYGRFRTLAIDRAEWIHLKPGRIFYAGK